MAIKIEYVVFVASVAIAISAFTLVLKENKKVKPTFTKEMIFTDTTLTEVNTSIQKSTSYSTYGVRDNAILYVDHLIYRTDTIKSLVSNKGRRDGDMLYLQGNVVLKTTDGRVYETEAANYNEKTEMLNITEPYVATEAHNVMKGKNLTTHLPTKESNGSQVDAVFYTIEK